MLFKFLNLNYTEGLLDWRLKSYLNFYSPPLSWKYSSVTGLKVTNFLGIWQFFYELAVVTFSSNMLSNSHLVILWMYQSYSRNMPRTFLEFFYEKSSRNVKILFLWIGNSRNTSITILFCPLRTSLVWLDFPAQFKRALCVLQIIQPTPCQQFLLCALPITVIGLGRVG